MNPHVLPLRERADVVQNVLEKRLETILPVAMRESGVDMWLILCQEDDYDPIFRTMIPMNVWAPILQMLIFYDPGDGEPIERINLSMTDLGDLYRKPWSGHHHPEQWPLLARLVEERDPQQIAINTGDVQWAVGGLTHNLYRQLLAALPERFRHRLVSAEAVGTHWLATLADEEIVLFEQAVHIARALIGHCYSREAITPNVTTSEDLEWRFRQQASDRGLAMSFRPFFNIVRSKEGKERYGSDDQTIRPGDMLHCDVGIRYLRLNTDHQQWAYVPRPGEQGAPAGFERLLAEAHRLQSIFMDEFAAGVSGNELLERIQSRAQQEHIPNPKVYSHSLGLFLHEPGPLIGLPWEQERCPGRGDVRLQPNYAFTMELSVRDVVPEWGEEVIFSLEEDVVYTADNCRPLGGRQLAFHLI